MTYLETSRKIKTTKKLSAAALKVALTDRLRSAFHVESVSGGEEVFTVTAGHKCLILGAPPYHVSLNIRIKSGAKAARILVDGKVTTAEISKILYGLALIFALFISMAGISLFFPAILALILYDSRRKRAEPQTYLEKILESLETEFGD
jgi:hypothetical protein